MVKKLEIIKKLIDLEVDVNTHNIDDGWAASIMVCGKGHEKIVYTLITADADVNRQNKKGETFLLYACKFFWSRKKLVIF